MQYSGNCFNYLLLKELKLCKTIEFIDRANSLYNLDDFINQLKSPRD